MGGFTLIGPSYTFKSLAGMRCRCTGYTGKISADIEKTLVSQEQQYLDLSIFPEDVRENMMKHHLGNNFNYTATKRLTKEEEEAKEKQWLTDMIAMRDNIYSEITYINDKPSSSTLDTMFATVSVDNEKNIGTKLEDLIAERSKQYS